MRKWLAKRHWGRKKNDESQKRGQRQGEEKYRWGTPIPPLDSLFSDPSLRARGATQTGPTKTRQTDVKEEPRGPKWYEALAPGSNIIKVSPTTSSIKKLKKSIFTVRNCAIAKFGTQHERKMPLKVYADLRGPKTSEKLGEKKLKEFTRKVNGNHKVNHKRRDPRFIFQV